MLLALGFWGVMIVMLISHVPRPGFHCQMRSACVSFYLTDYPIVEIVPGSATYLNPTLLEGAMDGITSQSGASGSPTQEREKTEHSPCHSGIPTAQRNEELKQNQERMRVGFFGDLTK